MESELVLYKADGQEVELSDKVVRDQLVNGDSANVSQQEITMFINLCKYQGLNPFLKEAYLIKYGKTPATIITGKYVFTKRAAGHPDSDGWQSGVITETGKGEMRYHDGAVFPTAEKLIGGWCEVRRKSWSKGLRKTVALSEYIGLKYNPDTRQYEPNKTWKEKPATMIEKVAVVAALREAYPDRLGGLYDADEMRIERDAIPEPVKTAELTNTEKIADDEAAKARKEIASKKPAVQAPAPVDPNALTPEELTDLTSSIQKSAIINEMQDDGTMKEVPVTTDNIKLIIRAVMGDSIMNPKTGKVNFGLMTKESAAKLKDFFVSRKWQDTAIEIGVLK